MKKRIVTALCLLAAIPLIFSSCSDTSTGPNSSDPTLEAVISYSPQSPGVGEQVTLDGTGSKDDQSIGYDTEWSFVSKPTNSTATISNTTQSTTTFTPDVAGDYVVKLQISNASESVSDEAETTISVTASDAKYVELSGSIDTDRTLEDIFTDPTKKDYLVTGDLEVNARLTVEPGVVIHFQEGLGMKVRSNGKLVAAGEAGNKIVFTGTSQSVNGYWQGINVYSNSVENKISHAEISYAGSKSAGTYFAAAALTVDQAKVQLTDVTISNSGEYGIQTRRSGSEFPMQNMVFEQNDSDHAYVHISQIGYFDAASSFDGGHVTAFGGDTAGDMTIADLNGAKYKVNDFVEFSDNITIDAGAEFEFIADAGIDINPGSVIKAQGTADNKIIFTGTSKTPGAWRGIFIGSSSVENIFEHVDISYGGSTNMATYFDKTNMVIDQAKVTLRNVSFTGSAGYGIQTRRNGSDFSLENCSFDNNASHHMRIHPTQVSFIDNQTNFNGGDVEVYGGDTQTAGSETWSNLNNGTYYFSASVSIENAVSIEAGTQFEMGADVVLTITGGSTPGVIKAIGTSTSPIVFTGRSKVKGAWAGILISSGSLDNKMDHVKIEYGGGKDLATYMAAGNLGVYNDGYLNISNSSIENSANYGIIVRESRSAVMDASGISYLNNDNTNLYTY